MITFNRWNEIKDTYKAFWSRSYEGERPLVHLRAKKTDADNGDGKFSNGNIWYRGEMFAAGNKYSSLEDFYTNPETVVKRYRHYFENLEYFGEAFPAAVINQGPGALAAYHGCTPRLLEDTIWFEHYIEDWDNDFIEFTEDNEWFQLSKRLISAFVEDARGEYMVGMPDINAVSNALSLMRDNSSLCMDLVMQPDKIKHYTARILETHMYTLRELYKLVAANQEGYTDWMGLWAPDLGFPVQCDLSALLSSEMFKEFFIDGEIAPQCEVIPYPFYHLDGPDCIRHVDELLKLDKLTGIQWQPGAGAEPGCDPRWTPMLQKIQEAGKNLYVYARMDEVEPLCRTLDTNRMIIYITEYAKTPVQAQQLMENIIRWSGR